MILILILLNLAKSQSDGGSSDGAGGAHVDGMKTMMMSVLDGFKNDMLTGIEALKDEVRDLKNLRTEVVDIRTDVDGLKAANETIDDKLLKIQAHAEQQEQYSRKDCIKFHKLPVTYEKDDDGVEKKNDKGEKIPRKPFDEVKEVLADIGVVLDEREVSACHRLQASAGKIPGMVLKLPRRAKRSEIMSKKKKLADSVNFKDVSINDALTNHRAALLRKLQNEDDVAKARTIEGKIRVELKPRNRREKGEVFVIDNLLDIYKIGWSKEKVESLNIFCD